MLEIDFDFFNNDWDVLLRFLGRRGNPPYIITGNLNLSFNKTIKSLGNLQSVGGYLDLRKTDIKSLGNLQSVGGYLDLRKTDIKSLGNLQSVGRGLYLNYSNIETLGNLKSVGRGLYLTNTPLSKTTTEDEIRNQVEVNGYIYF